MSASKTKALRPAPRFITREFADTLAGKTPAPYLRTHDPAQRRLTEFASSEDGQTPQWQAYFAGTIHFWREVSLAELPRDGRGADECYALLFEAAFELAKTRPEWAAESLENLASENFGWGALRQLAHQAQREEFNHKGLIASFAAIHAPLREVDARWEDYFFVMRLGETWFWAALLCATRVDENHALESFHLALADASRQRWNDGRLHTRMIRQAPVLSPEASRADLLEHPFLRLARLKSRNGSLEQQATLEFIHARCISGGFESEEDHFESDLTLACWVRDARKWAARLRRREPDRFAALLEEIGPTEAARVRALFEEELAPKPGRLDALDATRALIRWGHRRRGHTRSRYRGETCEFIIETLDAALRLSWLYPAGRRT